MKRLTILGIIACVGLVFTPVVVLGDPAGPPGGMEVKVIDPIPLPVDGDVNVTNTPNVHVTNTPDVNVLNDSTTPVPVTLQSDVNVSTLYRFVGYSSNTTTGDAGDIQGLYSLCQATFGSEARMCTTDEFFKSPNVTAPPEVTPGGNKLAWVHPHIIGVFANPSGSGFPVLYDLYYNNPLALGGYDCYGWTVADDKAFGLVITPVGVTSRIKPELVWCLENAYVTCCAP